MGIKTISLAAATLVLSTSVNASLIDFSEYSSFQWVTNSTFTTQDYTITTSGINIIANTSTCSPSCPDNGGYYFLAHGVSFSISKTNGDLFSLLDFDLGEAHSGVADTGADYINVTDGFISQNYYLDGVNDGNGPLTDFQNIDTSSIFNDVAMLTFTGFNTYGYPKYFSIDNLNFDMVVPVPAAVWLFGSGLIGLIGVARRKNA